MASEVTPLPSIAALAQEWLRIDKDPSTRFEIEQILATNDNAELERRLRKRIAFGTAGLRAKMEAGFSRMNSLTVIQTSQGLAEYALSEDFTSHSKGLVIGHDARHNSQMFAKLTASAFANKGFRIYWLGQVHTPMVPFSVCHYGAAVGVMVTASHNPAADNGYKVYWSNGAQILSPRDQGIAEAIERHLEPLTWEEDAFRSSTLLAVDGSEEVRELYIRAVAAESGYRAASQTGSAEPGKQHIAFTYTPMHGVGLPMVQAVVKYIGIADQDFHFVQSQAKPDPDFPTVRFPNPEEKGALDEAMKIADVFGDHLIFANDPDADRFAVAVKDDSNWRQLTGNQVGVLLGAFVMERDRALTATHNEPDRPIVATTAVSSRMLFAMARGKYSSMETLTGFKWLGNKAQEAHRAGRKTIFAYEEALGYMFPSVVWDKDGIAALAVFLSACQHFQSQGLTPWTKLQKLYAEYGYFEEANTYLVSPSADVTNQVFEAVRKNRPTAVGKRQISSWRDLTAGVDTSSADERPSLPVDPYVQMITCQLESDVVFTARGSGTEPKIKLYIEARAADALSAKSAAASVLSDLVAEWFKPEVYGLRLA